MIPSSAKRHKLQGLRWLRENKCRCLNSNVNIHFLFALLHLSMFGKEQYPNKKQHNIMHSYFRFSERPWSAWIPCLSSRELAELNLSRSLLSLILSLCNFISPWLPIYFAKLKRDLPHLNETDKVHFHLDQNYTTQIIIRIFIQIPRIKRGAMYIRDLTDYCWEFNI